MVENGWLPEDYMDEVVPPARETPDAWIVSLDDGAPALAAPEEDGAWPPRLLTDGAIVAFQELTDYGSATLTIADDSNWSLDRPMPPQANCVRADLDMIDESVESLVANSRIGDPEWGYGLAVGDHDLDYYAWSDPVPFRFDAATRRFMPTSIDDTAHG